MEWAHPLAGPVSIGKVTFNTEVLITYIRFDSLRHMDTRFELNGITFVWDRGKARSNWNKHGVSFE